jgi:ATP synthase protein I
MTERPPQTPPEGSERRRELEARQEMARQVSIKEQRKLRARRTREERIWFGLGTFGMVGWSVAVPTILGILLGVWLDQRVPMNFSWTIALIFAGITLGCFNAWYWINREREMIERGRREGKREGNGE